MKKTLLLSAGFLAALALASCGGTSSSSQGASLPSESLPSEGTSEGSSSALEPSSELTLLTPSGAPTLAFYDMGDDPNWTSTSDATSIPPALRGNDYDMVVFDGLNGLNVLSQGSSNYKLAKWITGGNFYVVSTTHEAGEAFEGSERILSFNETGTASVAFRKLSSEEWGWDYEDSQVTYLSGVQQVLQTLVSNPGAYDYYVMAEPVLTNAKSQLAAKGVELEVVYDIQEEWKGAGLGETLPAAALFYNVNSYAEEKEAMDLFLEKTGERIDTAVNNPAEVVSALEAYGEPSEVQARFGYQPSLVTSLQGGGKNRFGLISSEAEIGTNREFANSYQEAVGASPYDTSLFLF